MSLLTRLLLPPDVHLVPVAQLARTERRRLACDPDAWALTRPGLRSASLLVEASAAHLLAAFRSPRTLAEAVLHTSRTEAGGPEALLEAAFPLVERLLAEGFLVAADHPAAMRLGPSLEIGERFGRFTILRLLRAVADVEIYQARSPLGLVALKIARAATARAGASVVDLRREATILRRLDGASAPRWLASGTRRGQAYLALAWQRGVDLATAATELREAHDGDALLGLVRRVIDSYTALHRRGVIHGDVHPDNVLVDSAGAVHLVDFGSAAFHPARRGAAPLRAGIGFFFEPELARAALDGVPLPAPTAPGEQYALGVLLTFILSGRHYLDFALERTALLTQILDQPPLLEIPRWLPHPVELDGLLRRMLEKDPAERYPSLEEVQSALTSLASRPRAVSASRRRSVSGRRLLERILADLAPEAALFAGRLEAPAASVHGGRAGIAYGLYRLALATDDPDLLSAADLWSLQALAAGAEPGAFIAPQAGLTAEMVDLAAPAHGASGPPLVQALIAHARGDERAEQAATFAFVAVAERPCRRLDLTLGTAGVLLGAATLAERQSRVGANAEVTELGERALERIWTELERQPGLAASLVYPNLGMAHGWAGYLYATLRWCRATRRGVPPTLEERLTELAECAHLIGRGAAWRWDGAAARPAEIASMPGWCNGSAGLIHLFQLAADLGVGDDFTAIADAAAWNTWETPVGGYDLCCGLAGRAYGLLCLARRDGGGPWLERSRQLAERAAREFAAAGGSSYALYRGGLGIAVLIAELERPLEAAMPFFGDQGWEPPREALPATLLGC